MKPKSSVEVEIFPIFQHKVERTPHFALISEVRHMYWTGIDVDIEDYTKQCQECIKRSQVPKEPLQPHDIPEGPWRKLGIDYFTFDGSSYVLICDYFSKFPFLYTAKTSFWSLRDRLIDLFSIKGYPDEIVSDNGPHFSARSLPNFSPAWASSTPLQYQGIPILMVS